MTDDQLRALFAEFGEVTSASVISDRFTGRSKGFGFVEFASEEAAKAAIDAMANKEVDGRALVVNVARPKAERPERRSFGGGNDRRGGGGYGGGGYRG